MRSLQQATTGMTAGVVLGGSKVEKPWVSYCLGTTLAAFSQSVEKAILAFLSMDLRSTWSRQHGYSELSVLCIREGGGSAEVRVTTISNAIVSLLATSKLCSGPSVASRAITFGAVEQHAAMMNGYVDVGGTIVAYDR